MKRAGGVARLGLVLACGMGALAQSPTHGAAHAAQASAAYDVRIVPTTMKGTSSSIEVGGDSWVARGFDLRALIAQIYAMDSRRIELPAGQSADARYDVTLTLPHEVDAETMQRLLQDALEKKFKLSITPESRPLDVYVLTAPNGPGMALHHHVEAARLKRAPDSEWEEGDEEQITIMERNCSGVPSGGGITATAGTMPDLGRTLEQDLDRLLVDETHLAGGYDFKVGSYDNKESLFKLLREQLGLVITPGRRNVTVLEVRPEGSTVARAAM